MRYYKTKRCPDGSTHECRTCQYYHTNHDRRRNPYMIRYISEMCPNANNCREGDACGMAHNQPEVRGCYRYTPHICRRPPGCHLFLCVSVPCRCCTTRSTTRCPCARCATNARASKSCARSATARRTGEHTRRNPPSPSPPPTPTPHAPFLILCSLARRAAATRNSVIDRACCLATSTGPATYWCKPTTTGGRTAATAAGRCTTARPPRGWRRPSRSCLWAPRPRRHRCPGQGRPPRLPRDRVPTTARRSSKLANSFHRGTGRRPRQWRARAQRRHRDRQGRVRRRGSRRRRRRRPPRPTAPCPPSRPLCPSGPVDPPLSRPHPRPRQHRRRPPRPGPAAPLTLCCARRQWQPPLRCVPSTDTQPNDAAAATFAVSSLTPTPIAIDHHHHHRVFLRCAGAGARRGAGENVCGWHVRAPGRRQRRGGGRVGASGQQRGQGGQEGTDTDDGRGLGDAATAGPGPGPGPGTDTDTETDTEAAAAGASDAGERCRALPRGGHEDCRGDGEPAAAAAGDGGPAISARRGRGPCRRRRIRLCL